MTSRFSYQLQEIRIQGSIEDEVDDGIVEYVASAPPEVRPSYHGTGLPFASREQAFDNTPNAGQIKVDAEKKITFSIVQPNSYYESGRLIPPQVELYYTSKGELQKKILALTDLHVSDRSLRYCPKRTSPEFYASNNQPIRTQAEIFASKAVPDCPSFLQPRVVPIA